MYIVLFAGLFGLGVWLLHTGLQNRRRGRVGMGFAVLAGVCVLLAAMAFWAELLWFESLGFTHRFWTFVLARLVVCAGLMIIAFSTVWFVLRDADVLVRRFVAGVAAMVGLIAGLQIWSLVLLFINRVSAGVQDPMLGLDVGFYLFTLPLLDALFLMLFAVAVLMLLAALLLREQKGKLRVSLPVVDDRQSTHIIPRASLFLALVLAFGALLAVCHLLYSQLGVVLGPGWTDVYVRLPALVFMGMLFILAGALPLSARFRAFMHTLAMRWVPRLSSTLVAVTGAWLALAALWMSLVVIVPVLVQWLVVKPNEITFELPYIARNIDFTRKAFQLDTIEERQFDAEAALTREAMADNAHLLSEVRLWDWRALDAVYKQFQEIRLYYEFVDVDIDRYQIGDRYRQVMVSARELAQNNLSEQSQTFVNKRFKYTHGYGYTLAPVSDFTPEGLPNLLVKNIPPVTSAPELAVERPEIYYGELTTEPVVVNTTEPEFDYPSGETNMYTHYEGLGGVRLSSFWRKWLFGWKYDGTVFLLSSYPTAQSRILYHRQVQERVRRVAPFLVFDEDPYIVAVDGRLKWIVDAYTSSSFYPYSQPFDSREYVNLAEGRDGVGARTVQALSGANYVRNSVKAVVDAYDGSVELYVFTEEDPLIRAWWKAMPNLFKSKGDMPASVRAHVRYPQDLLLTQGLIFARYHMTDPEVFYNQEDIWVRATEKHYHDVKPVEPYYVMWEQPGSDKAEFVLMLPFTPKNRQVLIGWIAALSDGDNYGRFIAYKFPKEKRVLGPQQVETKIDQDSFLSGQLTLWNQQGSEVIRGNVLAIPVDDSLLYVEPIYLRAETAAYPELRLVAVMQGDQLSYAQTLEEALEGLFQPSTLGDGEDHTLEVLATQAQQAFENYLTELGDQQFSNAAAELERLSQLLQAMNKRSDPGQDEQAPARELPTQ